MIKLSLSATSAPYRDNSEVTGFWITPNRLALDKKLSLQTRGRYTLRRVAAGARLWSENRALLAPLLVRESGRTTRELRDRHTL